MQNNPTITFLIASYNTAGLLDECLSSVYGRTQTSFEVIVVDDASTDGSPALVREKYPQVRLFVNERNAGFVKTNNIGARQSRGKYLFLLNSDTRLLNDAASILAGYLDSHPNAGACGGCLKNADGTAQISFRLVPVAPAGGQWRLVPERPLLSRGISERWQTPHRCTRGHERGRLHLGS